MTILRKGSSGTAVKRCQEMLTAHGYPCVADGAFGAGTETVVMRFQRDQKLPVDGVVGEATWRALESPVASQVHPPSPLPSVLQRMKALGHAIQWRGDYHLNLFGIRNPNAVANSFDDVLGCAYTVQGLWRVHYWPGTTDPGTYYLKDKSKWGNAAGVAILVEGQYVDVWKIDLHKGKYEALCQRNGPVRLYRDRNLDGRLDYNEDTIQVAHSAGINIHAASSDPYNLDKTRSDVDAWSAGCQVHATTKGFQEMMKLARIQVDSLGYDKFTYTLLKQW